jgi:hypothetical protein
MMQWKVMPYWTRYYIVGDYRAEILQRVREDAGEESERILRSAVGASLRRTLSVLPQMQSVLDDFDGGTNTPEVDEVVATVAVHNYAIERVRNAMVADLSAILDMKDQPEEQIFLTILFQTVQQFEFGNRAIAEEPKKAAIRILAEMMGPEGIAEAVGGPDFLHHQCIGDIVLQDDGLREFLSSRLPIKFEYE